MSTLTEQMMTGEQGFHHSWEPAPGVLRVVVAPVGPSAHFFRLTLGALLCAAGVAATLRSFLQAAADGVTSFLALVFFLVLAVISFAMAYPAIGMLVNRCELRISPTELQIRHRGLLRTRTATHALHAGSRLRIGPTTTDVRSGIKRRPDLPTGVVLEAGTTVVDWFAQQLQGREAERLLSVILDRFPSLEQSADDVAGGPSR
jgi:hypothetical protein